MTEKTTLPVLVTGAAGFIGFHLCHRLLTDGVKVYGIDNLNDYYDVSLKEARLDRLRGRPGFEFIKLDLANRVAIQKLFEINQFGCVVHLAAQAGVRASIENPHSYIDSNLVGFLNILEGCRHRKVGHLVYASSSSVYGANTTMPFSVHHNVDHPVSLYAATKKANELMAHTYAHLYRLPCTGLRFFTVYGPWGRPDMALFKFTRKILAGEPIDVFNYGNHRRDFTYIDDVVEGIVRVMHNDPQPNESWSSDDPDPATSTAPYRLYNIGNNQPIELTRYIEVIEECLGNTAEKNLLPIQPGDVPDTYADVTALVKDIDYHPNTPIEVGIKNFIDWYRDFYGV
jgi:UDP-glucuronate 4-epimerase